MLLSPVHERYAADLRWYFRDAAGELGLTSNFSGMVASLEGGGWTPKPTHEMPERRLIAAERARGVQDALELTPDCCRVLLGIAYRYHDGEFRLLACTDLAAAEHRRSRTKRTKADWLERCRTSKEPKRRALWLELREHCRAGLEEALDSYGEALATLRQRQALARGHLA